MGQNKGIAQRIFNRKDFGTITIELAIVNLTAATDMTPAGERTAGLREPLTIGTSKALELLEFNEDHIVMGSTLRFGSLGHGIRIDVRVFSDQTRSKALMEFSSKCKISFFEEKKQNGGLIYLAHLSPQKGDAENWTRLYALYSRKQEEVNKYLDKIKGTE